ncbi:platelet-activating factor acetylhydrolase IB subunit alpha1-like, partial [Saccoglossus kowalevskii]
FVMLCGDSLLRMAVEGDVTLPSKSGLALGVNCTPGGQYHHISQEVTDSMPPQQLKIVLLCAGTNNISVSFDRSQRDYLKLLRVAKEKFPMSKIAVVSIVPRLDYLGSYVEDFNLRCKEVALSHGVSFIGLSSQFPSSAGHLWSHDGLHLSKYGLQQLLRCLEAAAFRMVQTSEGTLCLTDSVLRLIEARYCASSSRITSTDSGV